jgi:hypothetical protein
VSAVAWSARTSGPVVAKNFEPSLRALALHTLRSLIVTERCRAGHREMAVAQRSDPVLRLSLDNRWTDRICHVTRISHYAPIG